MTQDTPAGQKRAVILTRALARIERLQARSQQVSAGFSRWRLAIFVAGAACTVAPYKLGWYHVGNATLGSFLLLFAIVARYHSRLEDRMHRLRLWAQIKRTNLARLNLDWSAIPDRQVQTPAGHPYAADLDITGRHSLLQLLDRTVSSNGRERLADWLLDQAGRPFDQADQDRWLARQALIKELACLHLFSDRLALEAALVGRQEINGQRIQTALQAPASFPGLVPLLIVEAALAIATAGLLVGSVLADFPNYWVFSLAAYAILSVLTSGRTAPVFGRALSLHDELDKLGAVFRFLESRSYRATPALGRLCAPLKDGARRPSAYLRRLARVCQALSIRAHPLAHVIVNTLGPWDLFFTHRLETIRTQVADDLPAWLDCLAELDAATALGHFAYRHPDYHWPAQPAYSTPLAGPTPQAGNGLPATIVANALGHPLIPQGKRITNDLELYGLGRILIVTGSNMSGKSTFLRTIGINTCLAQAGAPVCAASFTWTWVRLACCIRVDDSLEEGLSYFYAEVKRLKQLLDAARDRSAPPLLFLIDEIFKGTNNRERLLGSQAYIRALTSSNGFGLITTHDLELAELDKEIATAANAHFQETVEANALQFDYRLRPGPCPTTNALRIMALEGLPVPDSTDSR
ncbi:MAG: hypothetical protein EPO64_07805 [Nitrospirae bacterium]|nr:MAG: hypothetical protein EPO64_07805 [Nitrospirota bacterium]